MQLKFLKEMFEFKNYKISWDSIAGVNEMPDELKYELEKVYEEIQNPKRNTILKLQKLIKKYPRNPQLKNYLATAYKEMGNHDMAMKTNDLLLRTNPNYFFGLVNKAYHYEENEEYGKMEELMGKGFDLKLLYPEREVFHISEFMIMQSLAVSFYTGTEDFEQAELRLNLMKEVERDSDYVLRSENVLLSGRLNNTLKKMQEEKELRITPKNNFSPVKSSEEITQFNFQETENLYSDGFGSDLDEISLYLSKDRDKLIEDLERVLKYDYTEFKDRDEADDTDAGFHAYCFLGELEAEETLPTVLEMMRMDESYRDRTFGDFMTQDGWMALMKMAKNQPSALEDYLKLPGTDTYFRSVAAETLVQMFLHFPDKEVEIKYIYKRLLQFFTDSDIEDNVIDSELNGFLISDLVNLRLTEFLPQIKMLYDLRRVSVSICGDYNSVEKDISELSPYAYAKREIQDIFELYEFYFNSDEDDYLSDKAVAAEDLYLPKSSTPLIRKKIGRNDPCPCGSGKKFKKCCLGKGIYD